MIKKFISLGLLFVFVFILFSSSNSGGFKHRLQTGAVALAGQDEKVLTKTFDLKGSSSEISGRTDGSTVTPVVGPTGTVKVRGQGSVNFIPTSSGNGISFEKGNTQNDNTAFYLFRGADIVNLLDYTEGEISFTLKSKYSYNERINLPSYYKYRTPFSIEDSSVGSSISFYTEPTQFTFNFKGTSVNRVLSQKEFEDYFDKDKELKVRLVWGAGKCSIYLNNNLYTSKSCATDSQLSSNSLMSIGADKPSSYGGGWWANDDIMSDFSISKYAYVDRRGPEIRNVSIVEDLTSASISWNTDEDSTGDVDYGTLLSYGKSVSSSNPSKNHSVSITGLIPGTFYNFIIRSRDISGNIAKTINNTFTTKNPTTVDPIPPTNPNPTNPPTNPVNPTPLPPIVTNAVNKITIKEISGQTQTNRVFSISRIFKQGDIANFPQAKIGGNTINTQADVKNRWPDGSVKHAMISFITTVSANSSVDVEFVNQSSCNCNSGLSATDMLSSKYGLDASMTVSPGGTVSARDIIQSGNFRYWLSGPIVTQVIVEDRTPARSFDLSFGSQKSFHPMFIVSFYPSDSNVKVDFIGENVWVDGLKDIKYSLTLNLDGKTVYSKRDFVQSYATRWRQTFYKNKPTDIQIDHNLAYLVSTKALPNFDTSIRISDTAINDGVNKPWNSQCDSPSWVNAVSSGKTDIGGTAQVCTYIPAPGGRPDLGLIPGWYVRYLYSMSSNNPLAYKYLDIMKGNADVSGSIRMNYRETKTNKNFSNNVPESAFGKSLSLDSRLGYTLIGGQGDAAEGDSIYFVPGGELSGRNGLEPELAHLPSLSYVPYIMTGDYYYLENQYMAASYAIGTGADFDAYRKRNPNTAGIIARTEYRGVGWGLREVGFAGFIAPDNTPEKEYFTRILNRNIAFYEGLYNLRDGNFFDSSCNNRQFNRLTETNVWCYGNKIDTIWLWYNSVGDVRTDNPMKILEPGNKGYAVTNPPFNTDKVTALEAPWGWGYNLNVWGMLSEMGYPFKPILNDRLKIYLYLTIHPDAVPQLVAGYVIPTRNGSGRLIQTPKEFVDAFNPQKIQSIIADNYSNAADPQSGYSLIAKAAMSYLPGVNEGNLRGQDAWNFIKNALSRYESALTYDQSWAIIPRYVDNNPAPAPTPVNNNNQNPNSNNNGSSNPILNIVETIIAPIVNIISPIPTPTSTPTPTPTPSTATPTPTITVPVSNSGNPLSISSVRAVKNSSTEVVITWNTNLDSDSNVEYRYSVGQGKWTYNTSFSTTKTTSHRVVLKNLRPNSIYYYKVWSKDRNANTANTAERIFNTIEE